MIDRGRLADLTRRERATYRGRNPRSAAAYAQAEHSLPWSVQQLGARSEYRFTSPAPRTGTESHAATDSELDDYLHVYLANRDVLMTPFHDMALMCPQTTAAQVDLHEQVFAARGRRAARRMTHARGS